MSTSQTIDELTNARDAIRAKMIEAGQAGSSDKLSILAENLLIEKIQQETMPTANASRLGKIYQYVGTTTNTYTNGYWYKCVENSGVYSYVEIEVESPGILNIQDNGTDMTYEDALNFIGFDVDDDSANGSTDVAVHELTAAEMAEIVTPPPGSPINDGNPVGTIISFMGTIAPYGYLICDGTAYNIADYSRLANFFEAQFGTKNNFGGDGTTTFAVPDLRGEFLRGTGTNSHTNQGSGANVGEHQNGTVLNNSATYTADTPANSNVSIFLSSGYVATTNFDAKVSYALKNYSIPFKTNETVPENSAAQITIRPTNTSVLYCIRY